MCDWGVGKLSGSSSAHCNLGGSMLRHWLSWEASCLSDSGVGPPNALVGFVLLVSVLEADGGVAFLEVSTNRLFKMLVGDLQSLSVWWISEHSRRRAT